VENTNHYPTLDWSILASPERRSSEWLIGDMPPETTPRRPVRVLLSVLDPALRRTLALGLRLDGHDVYESDDPVSPQNCLKDALADVVVCGASPSAERDSKPRGLIILSGAYRTQQALVRDPHDLSRLCELVREYRETA
jgi:hypothetical protein